MARKASSEALAKKAAQELKQSYTNPKGSKFSSKSLMEQGAPAKDWEPKGRTIAYKSLMEYPAKYRASEDDDVAKKLARIAAIKKAALNNKKYNVGTSTTADPTVNPILYGGGGGGVMITPEKPSFLSSIPSIVWIILAVGGAWYVLKSSGKK